MILSEDIHKRESGESSGIALSTEGRERSNQQGQNGTVVDRSLEGYEN